MRSSHGFTLLELMIVMTIIAMLATIAGTAYQPILNLSKRIKDVGNQHQIFLSLQHYAAEGSGMFPSKDDSSGDSGQDFQSSTDAFVYLIVNQELGTEEIFFTPGIPGKAAKVNRDGELTEDENCMSYVCGLLNSDPPNTPIVCDATEGGTYGSAHPWLKSKKAVITYVDGRSQVEDLTSSQPGATVKVGKIQNIFETGDRDERGKITGGFLPRRESKGENTVKILDP